MPRNNPTGKSLMVETQKMLKKQQDNGKSFTAISMETQIPEGFLYRFMRLDPSKNGSNVNTVQRLYEYLAQAPLLPN